MLVEKIEFAEVIFSNKADGTGPKRNDTARIVFPILNADVRVIETYNCDVTAEAILDTGLFDLEQAHEHPMRVK